MADNWNVIRRMQWMNKWKVHELKRGAGLWYSNNNNNFLCQAHWWVMISPLVLHFNFPVKSESMKVETKQNNCLVLKQMFLSDFQCYCHQHSVVYQTEFETFAVHFSFFHIFLSFSHLYPFNNLHIIICSTWENLKCKFLKYTTQITQNTKDCVCDFSAQKRADRNKVVFGGFFYIMYMYLPHQHPSIHHAWHMAASCPKQLPFASNQHEKSINKTLHAFHILHIDRTISKSGKSRCQTYKWCWTNWTNGYYRWTLYTSQKILLLLLYYWWKINNHCT